MVVYQRGHLGSTILRFSENLNCTVGLNIFYTLTDYILYFDGLVV
jgi:hypothetical protein